MWIFNFNQFIVEKLGVSEPSIQFVDILEEKCLSDFSEFLESGLKIYDSTKRKEIEKIPYSKLRPYIKDKNLYKDFPVVEFELVYLFRKFTDSEFSKKYPISPKKTTMTCGGWAPTFGNKNWKWYSKIVDPVKKITDKGLIVQIGVEININKEKFDIEDPETNDELKDNIGSTFWHELNHVFEHYQRTIKKTDDYKDIWARSFKTTLTYANENKYKFPKNIWKLWSDEFLYFIYKSELFELRSNVQEIGFFFKRHPNKDIKDFQIYKDAVKMENFDPYNFYHKLLKEISKYEPYKGDEKIVAENLKKMWVSVYKTQLESQKAKPIIPITTLENMDCLEFLRYWGKTIRENGTYIKKKIYKLKHGIQNEEI